MKVMVRQTVTWFFETDKYTIKQLRDDAANGGCLAIDMAREGDNVTETETISEVRGKNA